MLLLSYPALFATIASAGPALLVELSAPSCVASACDLTISTRVTNVGDANLTLLNDPRSVLSDLPTDIFEISNKYGTAPDFIGIEAKYVPEIALASNEATAFTTLLPGEAIEVEHSVSQAYDFSASGPGQYVIALRKFNTLYYTSNGRIHAIVAGGDRPFQTVDISEPLDCKKTLAFTPELKDCEGWQKRAVQGAIPLAKKYVSSGLAELAREGPNSTDYERWFGAPSESRFSTVASHFEALNGNNYSEFTYVCNTDFCASRPGVYAYVYPNDFGKIHVCDQFFRAPVGGRNSRASTLVHESSHFTRNGGTEDHAYGERLAQELARSYPHLAVMNADNHEYYAAGAHDDSSSADTVLPSQAHFGQDTLPA